MSRHPSASRTPQPPPAELRGAKARLAVCMLQLGAAASDNPTMHQERQHHSKRRLRGPVVLLCVLAGAATLAGVAAGSTLPPDSVPPGPTELSIEVRDARTREPIAARVRVIRSDAPRERRVLLTERGRTGAQFPPGDYEVIASHGPHWSIGRDHVTLRGEPRVHVVIPLRREVVTGDYRACDLHVHTDQSPDGKASLLSRVRGAEAEDLQLAVITDHNRATPVRAIRAQIPTGLALVQGVEVTSWAPEFGHFNVFPSAKPPRYARSSAQQLLAELPARSTTFLQVNHPRLLQHIGYFELRGARDAAAAAHALQGFDGVEVWNGYDLSRKERRDRVFLDWMNAIARGQHIVATGGSDSHDLSRNVLGYPRTYVREPSSTTPNVPRIIAALKAGRAFVSNGPTLELEVEGKSPGDTLAVSQAPRTLRVYVRADAPSWMDLDQLELWVNGKKQITAPIDRWLGTQKSEVLPRFAGTFELRSTGVRSIVALVRGSDPMDALLDRKRVEPLAFTNPVWIAKR